MFFSRNETTWSLSGIRSFEASLLEDVLQILQDLEEDPEVRKRLYPDPTLDYKEVNLDWEKYVKDEIRTRFHAERELFKKDIAPLTDYPFEEIDDSNESPIDALERGEIDPDLFDELISDEDDFAGEDEEDEDEEERDDGDPFEEPRIEMPLEHAECWHSVLNQTRLALDIKYALNRPLTEELVEDTSQLGSSQQISFLTGRMRAMIQSHFYAYLQALILENLMEP